MDNHWNAPFILKGVKLLSDKNQGDDAAARRVLVLGRVGRLRRIGRPIGLVHPGPGRKPPLRPGVRSHDVSGRAQGGVQRFQDAELPRARQRLMSGGGTAGDGVDALATMSANGDEIQILVYDYFATAQHHRHRQRDGEREQPARRARGQEPSSSPISASTRRTATRTASGSARAAPTNPTEAQWQAMRQAQHLALLQPVSKTTVTTAFTTSFTLPQAGARR